MLFKVPIGRSLPRVRLVRKSEETLATIDSAVHSGRSEGLQFTFNHFNGERASVLDIVILKDGTMNITRKEPGTLPFGAS
jgi:hypothetical protein